MRLPVINVTGIMYIDRHIDRQAIAPMNVFIGGSTVPRLPLFLFFV